MVRAVAQPFAAAPRTYCYSPGPADSGVFPEGPPPLGNLRSAGPGEIRRGWIEVQTDTASVSGLLTYRNAATGLEVSIEPGELAVTSLCSWRNRAALIIFKPDPASREDGVNPLGGVCKSGGLQPSCSNHPGMVHPRSWDSRLSPTGILPVSWLSERSNHCSWDSRLSHSGISPINWLSERSNRRNWVSHPSAGCQLREGSRQLVVGEVQPLQLGSAGISPLNSFWERDSCWRLVRFPSSTGIVPLNSLS